jgi:hypothetical protein
VAQGHGAGKRHWAGVVAFAATVGTVAMNVVAGHPELAATWAGPAIAGFPPVAALLATALRMAEERLRPVSALDTAGQPAVSAGHGPDSNGHAADLEIVRPVIDGHGELDRPVSAAMTPDTPDIAPVTDSDVADIVAGTSERADT